MELMKTWMVAGLALATLTQIAGANQGAGRMLGNAERAQQALGAGLADGASLEESSAKGFEGQELLMGLGSRDSGADAVDAGHAGAFKRFESRQGVAAAGLKAGKLVPTPMGYECIGPSCGGGSGGWGEKGGSIGAIAGRLAGVVLSFVAFTAAIPMALSGGLTGFAIAAAVLAGAYTRGETSGNRLLDALGSGVLPTAAAKIGGFIGKWTGTGLGKAAGFVKGLFGRNG